MVTVELENAVSSPTNPFVVYRHTPWLSRYNSEGMGPLENRAAMLQYLRVINMLTLHTWSNLLLAFLTLASPSDRSKVSTCFARCNRTPLR